MRPFIGRQRIAAAIESEAGTCDAVGIAADQAAQVTRLAQMIGRLGMTE